MRFKFDRRKSEELRRKPQRGIGFEEAEEIFRHPYYGDCRSDDPEQFRAIGWVAGRLYSLIHEIREDDEGEYYYQLTLWKSAREEQELYEESS